MLAAKLFDPALILTISDTALAAENFSFISKIAVKPA